MPDKTIARTTIESSPQAAIEIYKIYLASAEKVSDRRADTGKWFAAILGSLASLQGVFLKGALTTTAPISFGWIMPVVGISLCAYWWLILDTYGKLNAAKFEVLKDIERGLPVAAFSREQEIYQSQMRKRFTSLEKIVPIGFGAIFATALVAWLENLK